MNGFSSILLNKGSYLGTLLRHTMCRDREDVSWEGGVHHLAFQYTESSTYGKVHLDMGFTLEQPMHPLHID